MRISRAERQRVIRCLCEEMTVRTSDMLQGSAGQDTLRNGQRCGCRGTVRFLQGACPRSRADGARSSVALVDGASVANDPAPVLSWSCAARGRELAASRRRQGTRRAVVHR
jgi:hypothetical protein